MADSTAGGNPGVLLRQARSDLIGAAAMIDCLYADPSTASMELLEARIAVHNALVALGDWGGSQGSNARPGRVMACTQI